jgi:hypothetical protein
MPSMTLLRGPSTNFGKVDFWAKAKLTVPRRKNFKRTHFVSRLRLFCEAPVLITEDFSKEKGPCEIILRKTNEFCHCYKVLIATKGVI